MEFSRQEYWSTRLPFPTPRDIPHPGMEPASLVPPALANGSFITTLGKSLYIHTLLFIPPLIHSFSQPVFIECLRHARHCVRQQGQSNKQKDPPPPPWSLCAHQPSSTCHTSSSPGFAQMDSSPWRSPLPSLIFTWFMPTQISLAQRSLL